MSGKWAGKKDEEHYPATKITEALPKVKGAVAKVVETLRGGKESGTAKDASTTATERPNE